MAMKKVIAITAVMLYAYLGLMAQSENVHELKEVRCEYTVLLTESFSTENIWKQLRARCREEAIARVTSEVYKSWSDLVVINSESNTGVESLNSLINYNTSSREGEIVEFNIVKEGAEQGDGSITFYCVADVKVKTGVAPDPEFIVPVRGVKSVYFTGEELHFSFEPYKDCYMMLFLIENERIGYMLLPNQYVKEQKYMSEHQYNLNENSRSYIEFAKSPDIEVEYNKLIFLFTTKRWAFDRNSNSSKEIVEWIAKIPNNEKYIYQQIIEIRDK